MTASHQGQIYGTTLLHSHSEIVFLVKTTSTTAQFLHTSYSQYPKSSSSESLEFAVEGDDLTFIPLQSGIDSLLVWDSKKIFHSISSGQAVIPVEVFSSSGRLSPTPLDNQQVLQVVSDKQRSFAVLTDGNKIIFGREGILPQAVELDVSVPGNGMCRLHWIDTTHLAILCPDEEHSNSSSVLDFSTTVINIEEHLGLIATTSVCPVSSIGEHYDSSFLSGLGDTDNQEDLTLSYDYAKLGCPVKQYYGGKFKPKIDLYHDDVFVEEVLADYVLHEIHGVFTYGYTKTADQVGCVSAPQSWTSMIMQQATPDPTTAWTRKNYHSCFINGSELPERHQSYEVLSNATTNAIDWGDYNTIYVFHVTVVDPDYSFCQLSTQFAVRVYGALPKADIPAMRIVISTCGIGLGALAAGFIVHKVRGKTTEEEQVDQGH
ncbi:uncharacterized protein [Amphiura filiformis]|uniref:uncharacterized protein n=1 Tax=Amphiura filiformis TaxID=82378 RepID=UPI003B210EE6